MTRIGESAYSASAPWPPQASGAAGSAGASSMSARSSHTRTLASHLPSKAVMLAIRQCDTRALRRARGRVAADRRVFSPFAAGTALSSSPSSCSAALERAHLVPPTDPPAHNFAIASMQSLNAPHRPSCAEAHSTALRKIGICKPSVPAGLERHAPTWSSPYGIESPR